MRFTKAHNIKSALAEELGINNYPGVDISHCTDSTLEEEVIFYNLELLHLNCVGPILDAFEGNIGIKSAYRCEELNKAMGGSPNSQHIRGYAIDLVSPTFPTATLFDPVNDGTNQSGPFVKFVTNSNSVSSFNKTKSSFSDEV